MTTTDTNTDVRVDTLVTATPERAFEIFTAGIGTWWHPDHHIGAAPVAEMIFEPRVGGHVYDVGTDGSECRWSRVLAYEPPALVRFSWDITTDWELETDPAKASEIEVTFTPVDGGTHVALTHRHLDRHGDGWERMRDAVRSGWSLDRYADTVAGAN